jgi:hypothetical protein
MLDNKPVIIVYLLRQPTPGGSHQLTKPTIEVFPWHKQQANFEYGQLIDETRQARTQIRW